MIELSAQSNHFTNPSESLHQNNAQTLDADETRRDVDVYSRGGGLVLVTDSQSLFGCVVACAPPTLTLSLHFFLDTASHLTTTTLPYLSRHAPLLIAQTTKPPR
jgi:hypothetical protein